MLTALLGALPVLMTCCEKASNEPAAAPDTGTGQRAFARFTDITEDSGIDFQHDNGFDGTNWRVVETVNGGVALLDFDGDGRLDAYFTNGRKIDPGASPATNSLYRNKGNGRFEDVSKASGTDDASLSLGCAVADYDGDGRSDIYVTNLGPNRLYRNRGDGTFEDVAARAGVRGDSMDSGCAFVDADEDGDLDLYVASYVTDTKEEYPPAIVRGVPGYWPPLNYEAAPDHFYENRGDGTFHDVSQDSGIRSVAPGRGLGVLMGDFNADGFADVYVANDMTANFMFFGDGEGQFTESALLNGTALGEEGDVLGSMGADSGDYDGDGHTDLVVTNYQDQPNNLYRALSGDQYAEVAALAGVTTGTGSEVGWGVAFADLDQDGWQDLFIANGHLNPHTQEMASNTTYGQINRVFRNLGGRFDEVTGECGEPFRATEVSRGAAFGDLDNDGDVDIVVVNAHGRPQVLRNDLEGDRAWCLVELRGTSPNRDAIGARVEITAAGRTQRRTRRSAGSYLSVHDPRLHFGLDAAGRIDRLEIEWPGGAVQTHADLPVNRLLRVTRGEPEVTARRLGH